VDSMVLSLFRLSQFYVAEVNRIREAAVNTPSPASEPEASTSSPAQSLIV